MTRGGRAAHKGEMPERKCIATGEVRPISHLVRFVVGPTGEIVPDISGKLPGRGIWVSPSREALEKAVKKKLFARAAKAPVEVPEGLVDLVEQLLVKRVTDGIALARKSGRAVAGYEKVKGWLLIEEAALLIQAMDGSERGKSKLSSPPGKGTFVGCLSANEIGLAFGREHVIHAALASGGLTKRVVEDAAKLGALREGSGDSPRKGQTSHER
ncbi:MAG: RNA-binding protein [Vannielia sp.]|uniref:RNA-binding protein n=1 Tax=Rhodobacterales TaxID=204455 RepID=UPI002094C16F|nr:RNA-binding protein [Oceanicola sp. 502str15]MCO6384230.1 RNA-binding protein [Oceanicola sp. 502str15]